MKKKLSIFVLLLTLTSCYTTYKVIPEKNRYNEKINFTIDKVVEDTQVYNGNGYWKPSRGNKFILVFVTINNETNEKQDLNFDNFYLVNPTTKTKHKVEWTMLTGPINIWGQIESSIGKNDTKKRKLIFIYPENEKANFIMVNEKVMAIKYEN